MSARRGARTRARSRTALAVAAVVGAGLVGTAVPATATASARPAKPAASKPSKPASTKPAKPAKPAKHRSLAAKWGDDSTDETSRATTHGVWSAKHDLGSMWSLTRSIGAQDAWHHGYTGKGVTVAVIDTGIAPVDGLRGQHKVVDGPDLSYDGQTSGTAYVDGFGHGTHLAGIVAGEDAGLDPRKPSPTEFAGVAPDAQLLNLKVGAGDGGVDVSQVIAALDWVVAHRDDHGMNVRVVTLAYGTQSVQPWQVDPLAEAVENAWDHGLVVVTAAGNDGVATPRLLMPAADPHVLAVGAVTHQGTPGTGDDAVAAFSNGGSDDRRPDVVAPGKSVVSLRVPGSYVDLTHPEGLVTGDASRRFLRGSGTSQATAVVSGVVALLLDADPSLTPDQVKRVLRTTAAPLHRFATPAMGAGVVDVGQALAAVERPGRVTAAVTARTAHSTGTGSLEASRGGAHIVDPMSGDVLTGETDFVGGHWDGSAWARASAAGTAWDGGTWNGDLLAGTGWDGDTYRTAAWPGTSWSGVPWSAHSWSTSQWLARSWRNDGWSARSWREESWLARSWRGLLP